MELDRRSRSLPQTRPPQDLSWDSGGGEPLSLFQTDKIPDLHLRSYAIVLLRPHFRPPLDSIMIWEHFRPESKLTLARCFSTEQV